MSSGRQEKLSQFVQWATRHITGDEKGEAQVFLDHLFRAFDRPGAIDVGGTYEQRVRHKDRTGVTFADYVWKPIVLIEMKKRGVDLRRHYQQAFEYWTRLVPNRPRYVVLCNFDQFDVYDFDHQVDAPLDSISLADLPDRWGPLAFLFPTNEPPTFGNDRVKVTRAAADRLAACYNKLLVRKVEPRLAQRFTLQMLVALFAEDIGLLPKYFLTHLLDDCHQPADSYDLLGGLFAAMNERNGAGGGRYKDVRYFNGGLFQHPVRLELYEDEINQLKKAAEEDWSKVSPDIFGTLFEHSLEKEDRHAFGAHYTAQADILKIVRPTIVHPFEEAIAAAKSGKRLIELLERLATLRVLDPACGSGNFLYIAYREMKVLESNIRERLTKEFPGQTAPLAHVNARQFFGLDINPLGVELAKVTMMIGRKLAVDELHIADEATLPLDNLDANFRQVDSLITPVLSPLPLGEGQGEGERQAAPPAESPSPPPSLKGRGGNAYIQTPWPPADVIIGNPPFLGSRYMAKERGYPYVRAIHSLYPDVPKMADYCVYWIRRAHDHLPACTKADPFAGRAGLVGTQNIRNNQSRVGGLDHVVKDGTIVEAVDNQPWSGEANVHVSIANWIKSQDPLDLPDSRRLWTRQTPQPSSPPRKGQRSSKMFELKVEHCEFINAALSCATDVTDAATLRINTKPQQIFQGQNPANEAFMLEPAVARSWIADDAHLSDVIFPYMVGRDLVTDGSPSRWIIDFAKRDLLLSSSYTRAFQHVKEKVMPTVLAKAQAERNATGEETTRWTRMADRWWQFRDYQPGTMAAIAAVSRYIVCSRTTKRPVFAFVSTAIHPDTKLIVFPFSDDYSFGILQSNPHWLWFVTKCSKLKSDFAYTPSSVWDTFPWPQSPTKKQIDAVAAAGREVRRVRAEALKVISGGLRAVYRTLELPGKHPLKDAHAALDAAVLAAYGFDPKQDLLRQLLDLNHLVAARERGGQAVTAPGVPTIYGDPAPLITDDCIRPA